MQLTLCYADAQTRTWFWSDALDNPVSLWGKVFFNSQADATNWLDFCVDNR